MNESTGENIGEMLGKANQLLGRACRLFQKEGLGQQVEKDDVDALDRILQQIARKAFWLREGVNPAADSHKDHLVHSRSLFQ